MFTSSAIALAAPVHATLPDPARVMLEAAVAGGDETEVSTIVKYAQKAWPDSAAEIEARAAVWRAERLALAAATPAPASTPASTQQAEAPAAPSPPWKGKGELGGYYATGNSDYFGLSAGIALKREDPVWRHVVTAQADYQENDGTRTRERYLLSYQPNYRFNPRTYIYGLTQYEHDRFLGYDSRYALSAGIGYRTDGGKPLTVELETGPAYRFTRFVDGGSESTPAGRGSISVEWKLAPALTFNQNAAVYVDTLNSTINGTSALNARLLGPLSARLSYNVQYESRPPSGRQTTDTLSRVSLVYDF